MKNLIPIVCIVAAIALSGCGAADFSDLATADDIQGEWTLNQVSGTFCCSGILEYEFTGDSDSYDNTDGSVECITNYADFDYHFDDDTGLIEITGATAANAGLVDGNYFVYINDDEMAWEFEVSNPVTAYIFSKN